MNKEDMLHTLETYREQITDLKSSLQQLDKKRVWSVDILGTTKKIAIEWFDIVEPSLVQFGIASEVLNSYHNHFDSLLKMLAKKGPSKASFLDILDSIISGFTESIIVEVQKFSQPIGFNFTIAYIDLILKNATTEEKEYLLEALDCVRVGARRAAVIMGWCAAINRIHTKIEQLGIDEFNSKSKEMKGKTTGRYRRFNKSFDVSSLYELRATVFDTDLLWVLEYWQLIDSNQHHRLSTCFVMRSNSAHPGEAKISDENLVSFFSDLRVIIFDNPIFQQ